MKVGKCIIYNLESVINLESVTLGKSFFQISGIFSLFSYRESGVFFSNLLFYNL